MSSGKSLGSLGYSNLLTVHCAYGYVTVTRKPFLPVWSPGGERRKLNSAQYFNQIGTGHENAVQRPPNKWTDRKLRSLIEAANRTGDCIINVGGGYYRPVPGDGIDEFEYRKYIACDLSRARKILSKRLAMIKTFKEWKDNDLFTYHTRKAE